MKIDSQITPLASKQDAAEPTHKALFEDWLDTPTTNNNGDDYYWQHQNQLQESALTFTSINKAERANRPIEAHTLPHQERESIVKNTIFAPQPLLASGLKPDVTSLEPLTSLISPMNPLVSAFKKAPNSTAISSDSKIISKQDAKNNCIAAITKQSMLTNMVFKNHQLFINSNLAELTLNASHLSKQETLELQKLMKKWLIHKGYALTKLIINGVLQ